MKVKELIEKLKNYYSEDAEVCSIIWDVDDVLDIAEDRDMSCSKAEAIKIIQLMEHRYECTIGITWDTIDCYLFELEQDRLRDEKREKHCLDCNCRIEDEEGNAICGEFEQKIEYVTSCLNWTESEV